MGVRTGIWLLLLLTVNVVTWPLSSTGREMNPGRDLTPAHPQPEPNEGEIDTETAAQEVPCPEEQQHHPDALGGFLLALRDAWSKKSELGKEDFSQFGVCSHVGVEQYRLSWLLTRGEKEPEEKHGPKVLRSTKEQWDVNDDGEFTLTLHFPRPSQEHQQTTMTSITLLFFVDSLNTNGLNVKFSSHAFQPNKQTVCVSEDTQFLLLTGGQAESFSHGHLKLKIVVETLNNSEQIIGLPELQTIMARKDNRSNVAQRPVVIFSNQVEPHLVPSHGEKFPPCPLPSSRTFLFLCELQKFLNDVLPQGDPPSYQEEEEEEEDMSNTHGVLHSLPPLSLGVSSSESLLLELVNSSGPTVFSFPRKSVELRAHHVELALNPLLLSMLRQRLDEVLLQVQTEEPGRKVMDKLQILRDLSTLPDDEEETGTGLENPREVQYRALLLLKALQTVLGTWEAERAQRAARDGQYGPTRPSQCRLQSLTVSLQKFLLDPPTANINNCEGVCGFPLYNGNNHAILLNSHLQSGQPLDRLLCCVPVDYDTLAVIGLESGGAAISYKPNMVAKECGCR